MLNSCSKFLIILILSCHPNLSGKYPYPKEKLLQESKQILYLTLLTQNDTINGSLKNEIIQFQLAEGKLKSLPGSTHGHPTPGIWKISLLDQKNRVIVSQHHHSPLAYQREVFGETGRIELRKIELTKPELPLRFPYLPQMKKIQIDTLTLTLQPVTIFRQPLPDTGKLK